jgi:AcrR family transcriptional regulator
MPALRGRQQQAALNDQVILDAARAVFVADPSAPIAAVARRAGVGIAALYRRYPSKEDLLRTLSAEGLAAYTAATRAALDDDGEAWAVFSVWMVRIVEADTNSLVQRLAGTFSPTPAMYADARVAEQLTEQLFQRTRVAGVVRADLEVTDIALMFEMVSAVRLGDTQRTTQLRQRYLALLLAGLRASSNAALPYTAPNWEDLRIRWSASQTAGLPVTI